MIYLYGLVGSAGDLADIAFLEGHEANGQFDIHSGTPGWISGLRMLVQHPSTGAKR